jgi:ribosomal protein S18 acetylase RimI-like enzyme
MHHGPVQAAAHGDAARRALGCGGVAGMLAPVAVPPPIRVRRARADDLAELLSLQEACFPPEDRFPRRAWRRLVAAPGATALVAAEGAAVLAVAIWLVRRGGRTARLRVLATLPARRRSGLARALLAAGLARLPARITACALEVRAGNTGALACYRRAGFRPAEGLADHYLAVGALAAGHARREDGIRLRAPRPAVVAALGR